MSEGKGNRHGIFIGIIIFLCILCVLATGIYGLRQFINYKTAAGNEAAGYGVTVTGSTTRDFDSDLIVWRGNFSRTAPTTQEAYAQLKNDADIIRQYMQAKNVQDDELVFSSVNIMPNYTYEYFDNGNLKDSYLASYTLQQSITIQSPNVDNIEEISRDITQLIDSGVDFMSEAPEYYYTKLDDLKLEMIADATDNAKQRAELMAENSGGEIGKLLNATLGVFQITAQNSATDEFSAGGVLNTSSRAKTAQVTVKLFYEVK